MARRLLGEEPVAVSAHAAVLADAAGRAAREGRKVAVEEVSRVSA